MHGAYRRLLIASLGLVIIAGLNGQARAQERGVTAMEMRVTIVIHGDGSSTFETQTLQPIVTVTATGQRLIMPRCAAEPDSNIPREWYLRTSSRNTGTECIITLTTSHDTLQSLRDHVRSYGGDINESAGRFTLTIIRNDRYPQTPLLRYKMTYKYLITVPYLDSFSGGAVRAGVNRVAFTTTNPSHSIEIKGHLDRGQPIPPTTISTPSQPTPILKPTPTPTPTRTVGQEKRPYLGCWAARDGNVLFIAVQTIQTAKIDKPLSYQEVFRDAPHGLYLLKLLEVDESKEFQPYLSLEIVGEEMKQNGYQSYGDFLKRRSVGNTSWLKEDCQNVLPSLKTSMNENTQSAPTPNEKSGPQPQQDSKTKQTLRKIWDKIKKPN